VELEGKAFIATPHSVYHCVQFRSLRKTPSSQRQFPQRVFRARSVRCRGTEPSRRVCLCGMLPLPEEERKDRSCPRSPAEAASTCGNTPETSDTASGSRRNPKIDRAGSPCFPSVRAGLCRAYMTPAGHLPDSSHPRCTASAYPRPSKCFAGVCPDFLLSV